ncbi:hypothetical protein [Streptomyces sp. NBC_01187]|uniref:hypothetical protein n=1 Tax=Streptomyces sp. NBC_01187 TaxID=2903766 RepID=UPI00386A0CCF|nr:hypothetical protein OG220_28050 [Streptomyces sp. NBC_01187]
MIGKDSATDTATDRGTCPDEQPGTDERTAAGKDRTAAGRGKRPDEETAAGGGRSAGRTAAQALGVTCAVVVGIPALVILGFMITYSAERSTPEDYPEVSPDAMAARVTGNSLDAIDAMRLGMGHPKGWGKDWGTSDLNAGVDTSMCYPDGLESIADDPEPGAYQLSQSYEGPALSDRKTKAGFTRLEKHLRHKGWKITESSDRGGMRELSAERDGYGINFVRHEEDRRLRVGGGAPCAHAPGWKEGDDTPPEPRY